MNKVRKFKVSVIMNVHNGEEFIQEAIQSVLKQKYQNWELIIWDNKSIDKTSLIISKFKDKRIKYFKSDQFDKLYLARNKAINKSEGELICFLDSDDLWLPNKLSSQIEIMSNNKIDFCFSNYYQIGKRGLNIFSKKAFRNLPSGKIYSRIINYYNVGILTLCIRKEILLRENISFDTRFSIIGDFALVIELSKKGIAYADQKCLACYRSHENNLSKRKMLQVREMRTWFNDLKKEDKLDLEELRNIISLANYHRAKGLAHKLTFFQIIKITLSINNCFLMIRFLIFFMIKVLPTSKSVRKLK